MPEASFLKALSDAGSVLGIPLVLVIFYLWLTVKALKEEVAKMKAKHDDLRNILVQIQTDLAFIRGQIVKTNNTTKE